MVRSLNASLHYEVSVLAIYCKRSYWKRIITSEKICRHQNQPFYWTICEKPTNQMCQFCFAFSLIRVQCTHSSQQLIAQQTKNTCRKFCTNLRQKSNKMLHLLPRNCRLQKFIFNFSPVCRFKPIRRLCNCVFWTRKVDN